MSFPSSEQRFQAADEVAGFFAAQAERRKEADHVGPAGAGEDVLLIDEALAQLFDRIVKLHSDHEALSAHLAYAGQMFQLVHEVRTHGGGILYHEGRYYWYGEHRPERGFSTEVGITCYSSDDLIHWKYESVALPVSEESGSDIERGCIMERPKVIFNPKTRKFVLWFHLELKGKGYAAARAAVATADAPQGPFRYLRSFRLNPGQYPKDWGEEQKGKVIDVVQRGYKLGDKVLRYAKVVVGE